MERRREDHAPRRQTPESTRMETQVYKRPSSQSDSQSLAQLKEITDTLACASYTIRTNREEHYYKILGMSRRLSTEIARA